METPGLVKSWQAAQGLESASPFLASALASRTGKGSEAAALAVSVLAASAAQGSCLTVLPEYVIRAETAAGALRAIPVEGRPLWRTLKLVWAADAFFSPVARAFLEALGAEYPALAGLDERPVMPAEGS